MKQSSIEWLIDCLRCYDREMIDLFHKEINQAKEMHKQEVIEAFYDGKSNGMDISHHLSLAKEIPSEQYYNETFKTESNGK